MKTQRATLESSAAIELHTLSEAEFSFRYPDEGPDVWPLLPCEVTESAGALLIAYDGELPVACGALRRIQEGVGELKRMFTRPEWRGRGIARHLLLQLEQEARALELERLVLETGINQPEAIALYSRQGFQRTGRFGRYGESQISVFLEKRL